MKKQIFETYKTEKDFCDAVTRYENLGYTLAYYHMEPGHFQATFNKI